MVTKVLVGVLKAVLVAATFYALLNPASFVWAGAMFAVSTHSAPLLMSIVSAVTLAYGYSMYTVAEVFHKIRNHFKPQRTLPAKYQTGVITHVGSDVLHFAPGTQVNVSSFDGYEAE